MKRVLIVIFCFFVAAFFAQHNSNYVQYMFNAVLLNPAYAGSQDALNITTLYRRQWAGFDGAPVTLSFGAHTPLKNNKLNLGLTIENDRVGLFEHTRLQGMYAYRLYMKNYSLSFGAQFGADIASVNWNNLVVRDNNDPNFTGNATRKVMPVAGAGVYLKNKNFYAGISSPTLLGNTLRVGTILSHAGGLLHASNDFVIKPACLIRYIAGSPLSVNTSATFYYKEIIGLGFGYTHKSSTFVLLDLKLNEQLSFGYGYDRGHVLPGTFGMNSHEVMLRYLFRYKVNTANPRFF